MAGDFLEQGFADAATTSKQQLALATLSSVLQAWEQLSRSPMTPPSAGTDEGTQSAPQSEVQQDMAVELRLLRWLQLDVNRRTRVIGKDAVNRPSDWRELKEQQAHLAMLTGELLTWWREQEIDKEQAPE